MKTGNKCILKMVPTRLIKRLPGTNLEAPQKAIKRAREISKECGYYRPIILSDSPGCLTLIAGAVTFEACLEDNVAKVPAVIVETEGEADGLLFALRAAELDEPISAIMISAIIVQLIDMYEVPRKHIANTLGKSPAWINKMENLSRKLNITVRKLVAEGRVPPRSAQEIARLPDEVQLTFAYAACNEFLSKNNITYLVNRYLNEDIGTEERDRIIRTPGLALPNELKTIARAGRDNSDSARLARAVARCLDDAMYLSRLLARLDIDEISIHTSDITALSESLSVLLLQVQNFYPGKKT